MSSPSRRSKRLNVTIGGGFSLSKEELRQAQLAEQIFRQRQHEALTKPQKKKRKSKKKKKKAVVKPTTTKASTITQLKMEDISKKRKRISSNEVPNDQRKKSPRKESQPEVSITNPNEQQLNAKVEKKGVTDNTIKQTIPKTNKSNGKEATKAVKQATTLNKNELPVGSRYAVKHSKHHVKVKRLRLDDALKSNATMSNWSDARKRAYTQREVRPNSYYYRFNDPGEPQRAGGWSPEEHKRFLARRDELGGFDYQWGIFARGIPGRVGYQCSNYYRKLIEKKVLTDPNYIIDEKGKAKFMHVKGVGSKGQQGKSGGRGSASSGSGKGRKRHSNAWFGVYPNGALVTLLGRILPKKPKKKTQQSAHMSAAEQKKKKKRTGKIPEVGESLQFRSCSIFQPNERKKLQIHEGEAIVISRKGKSANPGNSATAEDEAVTEKTEEIYVIDGIYGRGVRSDDPEDTRTIVKGILKCRRLYTYADVYNFPGGEEALSARKTHDPELELFDSIEHKEICP
eukprot:g4229.t1